MDPKETLITNLKEIDALEDHAYEPFQNQPGKRLFVQTLFVLLCAAVGAGAGMGMAWLFTKLDAQTLSLPGVAVAIILPFIFAGVAIWAIVRSSRNYRRYRGLCQELRELQHGSHDQEFVTATPDINELNDMERWILGKPEATVDQLMAPPQSRAVVLPWWQLLWQLLGRSRWHLPGALIATLALILADCVLLPLYSPAAGILIAVAPIPLVPLILVFLRWRMFRLTNYRIDPQSTLLTVLTSQNNASFYQHWLLLHRLKTKGLIDPQRMEPFEDGFPTTKYLFSVFHPLSAVLPIEPLTINSTKLEVVCNRLSEA